MFYNKLNIIYLGLQDQRANVILNVKAVVVLVQVNFFHTDTFLEWSQKIYFVWAWSIFTIFYDFYDLCSEALRST